MNSSRDITTFSTSMLVSALDTLQIAAAEDDGDWGAEFPQGTVIFVPDGDYFTIRIQSHGTVSQDAMPVAMNAINAMNDNLAFGKVVPNVIEGRPTVVFRNHFNFTQGVSQMQLDTLIDASLQDGFNALDQIETLLKGTE
ncbi:YbjN domain-containing protein [Corynebacterium sp. Marseille-P3884]|uniref:YbjN domain-containing protein n=1 Tax=Corynebacterium sp. Marseille-P3884 TaxID=2495409 RepID=UPI001B34476B|nr:YbjN domain-containing protein [Corynebacterium sp. Marseille-P3884]MBP3949187.1 YbjN domain-containing protein [Corynebacterium sp. Marseille-P3884]